MDGLRVCMGHDKKSLSRDILSESREILKRRSRVASERVHSSLLRLEGLLCPIITLPGRDLPLNLEEHTTISPRRFLIPRCFLSGVFIFSVGIPPTTLARGKLLDFRFIMLYSVLLVAFSVIVFGNHFEP